MTWPKVTILIVTYNSEKYIMSCLEFIFDQTYRDFQILVVDNNSQDETVGLIKKNYPTVTVFQNNKNLGFSKANNQGVKLLNSPYILFCNPDIVLTKNWLELVMSRVESSDYQNYASFGGKVLKMTAVDSELGEFDRTDIIDSCGLVIMKNHRVVELGAGEPQDNYQAHRDVLGHSGSLVLYKKQALDQAMIKNKQIPTGEYFDEDFFFYKEDVDLAWRLQLLGWHSLLIPEAVAYHPRTMSGSEAVRSGQIIKNRMKQSSLAKYYSYRNHFFILIKNQFLSLIIKNLPYIAWFELKKLFYIIFLEPRSLKALWHAFMMWPKMLSKRRYIMKKVKIDENDISKWIV